MQISTGKTGLFVFVAASFLLVCFPLINTDIWWHLAAGRDIWQQARIPRVDTLSVVTAGRAWIDIHWLFQLFAHAVHQLGGVLGLVLAKCGLFAAGAGLIGSLVHKRFGAPMRSMALVLLLAVWWSCHPLVLVRPIIFSLVLSALFLWTLERERTNGPTRWLWLLPLAQVAWVNSQSLFVIGPGLVGAYGLGLGWSRLAHHLRFAGFGPPPTLAALKRLAFLLLLTCLASLANPWGWDVYGVVGSLARRITPEDAALFSANVSENVPTWIRHQAGDAMARWFLLIGAVSFLSFLAARRHIRVERLLIMAGLFLPAMMANRNILLFCWLAVPLGLANLGQGLNQIERSMPRRLLQGMAIGMLALATGLLGMGASLDLARPAPFRVPTRAVDVLKEKAAPGNVFSSVRFGGYVAWRLAPERRPIIDGRLILRSPLEFTEYLGVLAEPGLFDKYIANWRVNAAILPVHQPTRYQGLIRHLYHHADWRLTYTDGWQTLFIRSEEDDLRQTDLSCPEQLAAIGREIRSVYPVESQSAAFAQWGILLNLLGYHNQAISVLRDRPDFDSRTVLARSYYLAGHKQEAGQLAAQLVSERPQHGESLLLLERLRADDHREPRP